MTNPEPTLDQTVPFLDSTYGNLLRSKQLWLFDLDNTLHDYRSASSGAMEAVYTYIQSNYSHSNSHTTPPDHAKLRKFYTGILKEHTSTNFIEKKPAREHRSARFRALLDVMGF